MDPKQQINQLDPKLKEAYERVMGTPVGGAQAAQPNGTIPSTQPPAPATPVQSAPSAPMPPAPPAPPAPNQAAPAMPHFTSPQPMPQPVMPMSQGAPAHVQQNPAANPFGLPAQPQAPSTPSAAPAAQGKPGAASHGFVANKKGLHISPIILIVAGVIFLLVYTVFWFKFFNIPLPLIGQ